MSYFREFIPKSHRCLTKGYKFSTFKKDLVAGVTVGIIALPLAMAFAIASGVSPERGLYTAIVAGFLISALGGSRVQIGGPTGAFVVIIYGVIQRTGYEGLCLSTLIAAVLLICLGLFRIGSWIKYVPHPLIVGFTAGLSVVVFSTQVKDFCGLHMGTPPADLMAKWQAYFAAFPTFDPSTLAVAAGTLAMIICLRRFFPWLPWGIVAILITTIVCALFHIPVETIQSRFGGIPRSLPLPALPNFAFAKGHLQEILAGGFVIAFLGGIESLLSAVIGDGMTGGRHRSNGELVAQGIANIGSVVFGGIPATGAIARTVANAKSGAETPVAGMIHAVVLFLIMVYLAPLVGQIPLSALAAVLVMVAWNMSERREFVRLFKTSHGDKAILLTAFFLTLFVDITVAISVGMILASLIFMKQMSHMSKVVAANGEKQDVPSGIEVYELQGPFFFGAAHLLRDVLRELPSTPKVFILNIRLVPMIDASGLHKLEEFFHQCEKRNIVLFISGARGKTEQDLHRFGLMQRIGEKQSFAELDLALKRAEEVVSSGC